MVVLQRNANKSFCLPLSATAYQSLDNPWAGIHVYYKAVGVSVWKHGKAWFIIRCKDDTTQGRIVEVQK